MTQFATVTPAPDIKHEYVRYAALLYAGLLVMMAVAQLFKFEEFVPLLASFGLSGGARTAQIVASLLVVAEVLALPYLLRMYLSPLFRILSMMMGWLVVIIWLFIMVSVLTSVNSITDAGFLGTAIEVPLGWWSVAYVLFLGGLMSVATWGMVPKLPVRRSAKK